MHNLNLNDVISRPPLLPQVAPLSEIPELRMLRLSLRPQYRIRQDRAHRSQQKTKGVVQMQNWVFVSMLQGFNNRGTGAQCSWSRDYCLDVELLKQFRLKLVANDLQ
mmetsp:Transcript_511/g.875  ORF Transcript_511/g.875 Transcript_511/m.875 type:complete len:107 (-) Transcript_511:285-605(-)